MELQKDADAICARCQRHSCTAYCSSASATVDGGQVSCRFGAPWVDDTCACGNRECDRPPTRRRLDVGMQTDEDGEELDEILSGMLIRGESDAEGGAHAARRGWSGGGATAAAENWPNVRLLLHF